MTGPDTVAAHIGAIRARLHWSAVLSGDFCGSVIETLREVAHAARDSGAGRDVEIPTGQIIENAVADWRRTAILSDRFVSELIGYLNTTAEIAFAAGEQERAR